MTIRTHVNIDGKRVATRVAALEAPPATPPRPAALSVSVDLVQTLFNWEWAFAEHPDGVDRWAWWARDIRLDPAEVIASDGEGGTWRVPFTTDGETTITFNAPERVREDYVPAQPPEAVSAFQLRDAERPPTKAGNRLMAAARAEGAISYLRRTLNATPAATPRSSTTPEEEAQSDMTDEQRRALALSLGLSEDASEADIHTAAATAAETPPEEPETPETPEALEEPETPAAEIEAPEPVGASLRAALGLPSTATDQQVQTRVAEMEAGARAGAEARRAQLAAELDTAVDERVRDGAIYPSARDVWRQAIDPGENPTTESQARAAAEIAALRALSADRVPVGERGSTPPTDQSNNGSLERVLSFSGLNRGRQEKS